MQLKDKRVLVTGDTGMLSREVIPLLKNRGAIVYGAHDDETRKDLTDWDETLRLFEDTEPEIVLHLAGFNGGIEFNRKYPADIFTINTLMGINVLCACQEYNVEKVVSTITSCSYPSSDDDLLSETTLHDGPPHPSVACHGYAKRNIEICSRMLNQQHNLPAYTVCLTNLYGPHDKFNNNGKVVSNLIQKFVDAKAKGLPEVLCWGTGTPERSFLYVSDAAELVIRALEKYEDVNLPLNIGSSTSVSVRTLAEEICSVVGFGGEIVWDTSKPDGAMKKTLDTKRMGEWLGDFHETELRAGLKKTIDWYQQSNNFVQSISTDTSFGRDKLFELKGLSPYGRQT